MYNRNALYVIFQMLISVINSFNKEIIVILIIIMRTAAALYSLERWFFQVYNCKYPAYR